MLRPYKFFSILVIGLLISSSIARADDKDKSQSKPDNPESQDIVNNINIRERLPRLTDDALAIQSIELERDHATGLADSGGGPLFRSMGVGMFAASASDLATTEWGLARGHHEGNPLARSRGVRLLHHVVGPAAVWYTSEKLQRSGRTKLALVLRVTLVAAYSYAAVHNARKLSLP